MDTALNIVALFFLLSGVVAWVGFGLLISYYWLSRPKGVK